MIRHTEIDRERLRSLIASQQITLGGHQRLKIYGTLNCASGKRMKTENRVFFADEAEAKSLGYRPCGHCMRQAYLLWRAQSKT